MYLESTLFGLFTNKLNSTSRCPEIRAHPKGWERILNESLKPESCYMYVLPPCLEMLIKLQQI